MDSRLQRDAERYTSDYGFLGLKVILESKWGRFSIINEDNEKIFESSISKDILTFLKGVTYIDHYMSKEWIRKDKVKTNE